MDKKETNQLIWNVSLLTTSIILTTIIICCAFLSIFAPNAFGNILYSVGLRNTSLISYEYGYTQSNDIDDLYNLLSKSIFCNNDKYIVSSFEEFYASSEYESYVIEIQNSNVASCSSIAEMLLVNNEDNYLKTNYINALYNLSEIDKAYIFASLDMNANISNTIDETHNFALAGFIDNCRLLEDFEYFDSEKLNYIYDFYQAKLNLYNISFADLDSELTTYALDKYRVITLGYRIIDITRNMIQINNFLHTTVWDTDSITTQANTIQTEIIGLL